MRTILDWKCGDCNSVQKSDSAKRWAMDYCDCGKSFVDLEEHYQRNMGEVIILNTAVFGEIDTSLQKNYSETTKVFEEFLKDAHQENKGVSGEIDTSLEKSDRDFRKTTTENGGIFKKPLTPKEVYKKPDEGISEGLNEGTNEFRVIFIVFVFFLVFLLGTALGLWIETSM